MLLIFINLINRKLNYNRHPSWYTEEQMTVKNTVDFVPGDYPWLQFDYLSFVTVSLVIQTKCLLMTFIFEWQEHKSTLILAHSLFLSLFSWLGASLSFQPCVNLPVGWTTTLKAAMLANDVQIKLHEPLVLFVDPTKWRTWWKKHQFSVL